MSNDYLPTPGAPRDLAERIGSAELHLNETAAAFADAVEEYLADLAEGVPLPEAQLGHIEFHLDTAWQLHGRIERMRGELTELIECHLEAAARRLDIALDVLGDLAGLRDNPEGPSQQ